MRIIKGFSTEIYCVCVSDEDFAAERDRVVSLIRCGCNAAMSGISEQRFEQLKKYKNMRALELSLAATMALREGLKRIGLKEADMGYEYNNHGKPFIKGVPGVSFSLSHAGNMAVAVVTEAALQAETGNSFLGIDIEQTARADERIAARFFSEGEQRLYALAKDRAEMFTKIWTAHEAFGKAVGCGLALEAGSMEYVLPERAEPDCNITENKVGSENMEAAAILYLGTEFPIEHGVFSEGGEKTVCTLVNSV